MLDLDGNNGNNVIDLENEKYNIVDTTKMSLDDNDIGSNIIGMSKNEFLQKRQESSLNGLEIFSGDLEAENFYDTIMTGPSSREPIKKTISSEAKDPKEMERKEINQVKSKLEEKAMESQATKETIVHTKIGTKGREEFIAIGGAADIAIVASSHGQVSQDTGFVNISFEDVGNTSYGSVETGPIEIQAIAASGRTRTTIAATNAAVEERDGRASGIVSDIEDKKNKKEERERIELISMDEIQDQKRSHAATDDTFGLFCF